MPFFATFAEQLPSEGLQERTSFPAQIPTDATKAPPDMHVRGPAPIPAALAEREYVSASEWRFMAQMYSALPSYIDDISRDFGDDIYDRMMIDAQVFSCLNVRKLMILADGIEITLPRRYQNPRHPLHAEAKQIARFCSWMLDNIEGRPFELTLFEMADHLAYGHKLAELTYALEYYDDDNFDDEIESQRSNAEAQGAQSTLDSVTSTYAPRRTLKMVVKRVNIKPRRTYSFVVDAYMRIIGLQVLTPDYRMPILTNSTTLLGDVWNMKNLLPREKFAILTHCPKNGDPRGSSALRPVYDPWWNKQLTKAEFMKHNSRFASPSVYGITGENTHAKVTFSSDGANVDSATIADPTLAISPEQRMLNTLVSLRNGSAAVFPPGSLINQLDFGASASAAFTDGIQLWDKQISKGILGQTLATEEAEYMARASAETHKDVLKLGGRFDRQEVAGMVKQDILYRAVAYNYGETAAKYLTPDATMGKTEQAKVDEEGNPVAEAEPTKDDIGAIKKQMGSPQNPGVASGKAAQLGAQGSAKFANDVYEVINPFVDRLAELESAVFDDNDPWTAYTGPKGGKGWKHKQTGEIVYGKHPGGGAKVKAAQEKGQGEKSIHDIKAEAVAKAQQEVDAIEKIIQDKKDAGEPVWGEWGQLSKANIKLYEAMDLPGDVNLASGVSKPSPGKSSPPPTVESAKSAQESPVNNKVDLKKLNKVELTKLHDELVAKIEKVESSPGVYDAALGKKMGITKEHYDDVIKEIEKVGDSMMLGFLPSSAAEKPTTNTGSHWKITDEELKSSVTREYKKGEDIIDVSSMSNVDKKVVSHLEAWRDKVGKGDVAKASRYTTKFYAPLNSAMRKCPNSLDCLDNSQRSVVKAIEKIIDSVPPLKKPINLYRGVDLPDDDVKKIVASVGKTIQFNGIISLSLSPGVAANFGETILHVRVKRAALIASMSDSPHEMEAVQKHGTKYKVVRVDKEVKVASKNGRISLSNVIVLEEV